MMSSSFHNKLKKYPSYVSFFGDLGIQNEEDLKSLGDSNLKKLGYSDVERIRIIRVINHILGFELPSDITFAFDFDGTLTPHPGSEKNSLWYLGPKRYYDILTPEERDRMVQILVMIDNPLIIISKNTQENIREFLFLLNSEFPKWIDMKWSAFRDGGYHPTYDSKARALLRLDQIETPIFYVDDSDEEIKIWTQIHSDDKKSGYYHAIRWIGDLNSLNRLKQSAVKYRFKLKF